MSYEEAVDCAKPMAAMAEHEELQRTVQYKRKLLAELREKRAFIENELHNTSTQIQIHEVAVEALSNLADRCETLHIEHQNYLKRFEPVAENGTPGNRY